MSDIDPPQSGHDSEQTAARNSSYGLILFAIYLAFYGTFVVLMAFRPSLMEATPIAGLNLAVLYGLGLIIVALILAFLYGWLCRAPAEGPIGSAAEPRPNLGEIRSTKSDFPNQSK